MNDIRGIRGRIQHTGGKVLVRRRRSAGRITFLLVIGALIALLSFGQSAWAAMTVTPPHSEQEAASDLANLIAQGELFFRADMTPEQGLGPLFNGTSCLTCHNSPSIGGMGTDGLGIALRVGRLVDQGFDSLAGRGGPVARAHSVASLGHPCQLTAGVPPEANLTSVRNAPPLFGLGLIDAIPDEVIVAGAVARGDGVQGRPNWVRDANGQERVGKFGWKADTATLELFVAEAFRNEHGITNPLAPQDVLPDLPRQAGECAGEAGTLEDDGTMVRATTVFVASLVAPTRQVDRLEPVGAEVFQKTGCIACHVPSLRSGNQDVYLYSDLLLHDLGPALDDGVVQGQAQGRDWRTTPLWGLKDRTRFLHDGRARTVTAAILAHGGEAEVSVQRFRQLTPDARNALLAFLASL